MDGETVLLGGFGNGSKAAFLGGRRVVHSLKQIILSLQTKHDAVYQQGNPPIFRFMCTSKEVH
jgi:hypothetical protein